MSEVKIKIPEHDQERFWRLVEKTDSCWLWRGGTYRGYGCFQISKVNYRAHRLAYILIRGEIPDGKHLDHLCRVRNCVNPDHLDPVSQRENTLRGEGYSAVVFRTNVCGNGHSMENAYVYPSGKRTCRVCRDAKMVKINHDNYLKRKADLGA